MVSKVKIPRQTQHNGKVETQRMTETREAPVVIQLPVARCPLGRNLLLVLRIGNMRLR